MSAERYSANLPGGNAAGVQGTTVGGSKPLHRFIRGQPKIVGIIILALGMSFFIISFSVNPSIMVNHNASVFSPGFVMGTLFIINGILFIVTEHIPTKKTVTMSLALSIVAILGAFWCALNLLPDIINAHYYRQYHYAEFNATDTDDKNWFLYSENIGLSVESIFLFYTLVALVIFIAMSALAGAALRSTKSQAVVVMTAIPTETPVE